jgi:hypothetical protein
MPLCLSRREAAAFLSGEGFKVAASTLTKMASAGGETSVLHGSLCTRRMTSFAGHKLEPPRHKLTPPLRRHERTTS